MKTKSEPVTYTFRCSFCGYSEEHKFAGKPPLTITDPGSLVGHSPGDLPGRWRPFSENCFGALWLDDESHEE